MPVVRIPESLRDELSNMGLTIWNAMHPMRYDYEVGGKQGKGRHDKTRVMVQLAGPGLDNAPWGYGGNLQEALNDALRHPEIIDRVGGLKGSMMRLDKALGDLKNAVIWSKWQIGGEQDDEIPF